MQLKVKRINKPLYPFNKINRDGYEAFCLGFMWRD